MKECSKSIARRMANPNFLTRYFVGDGLDIGGKPDPLVLYRELFPLIRSVRTWDWEDGDAQFLKSVADGEFQFVHSSHCLEHLLDPREGIRNWLRVVAPGGYLVISVPDEDLYEQGVFPSTFNRDHKWTFTIRKRKSWSEKSINLLELLNDLDDEAEVQKIELLNSSYRYLLPRYDQSLTPVAECGIEFVIRKRPAVEVEQGGQITRTTSDQSREIRLHLNQYRDDMNSMKRNNAAARPFENDAEL